MALRSQLREQTSAAHASVERLVAFDASAWTLARYRLYLRCMHAFHRDVEDALARNVALARAGIDVRARRKSHWLESDLAWFGVQPIERGPDVADLAEACGRAFGWAYVLEGATLGGRVLFKPVAARWSLGAESGAAYLFGYGEGTSRMWTSFAHALDAASLDEAQACEAVHGANAAFATLEDWLVLNAWRG